MGRHVPVPEGLHRFEGFLVTHIEQPPDLRCEPIRNHPFRPSVDPLVQAIPVQPEADSQRFIGRLPETVALLKFHDRFPGILDHLQRADDPDAVTGVDPVGSPGIPCLQPLVQVGLPPDLHFLFQFPSQLLVRPRSVDQPPQEGPDVEPGPADDENRFPLTVQCRNDAAGHPDIACDVERFIRIGHIDEVVENTTPLFRRRFRRADIHVPVYLHGIGADDFAAVSSGQFQGRLRFSDGSRSENADHPRFGDIKTGHARLSPPEHLLQLTDGDDDLQRSSVRAGSRLGKSIQVAAEGFDLRPAEISVCLYGRAAGECRKDFFPLFRQRQTAIPFHAFGQQVADQRPRLRAGQEDRNGFNDDGIPAKGFRLYSRLLKHREGFRQK